MDRQPFEFSALTNPTHDVTGQHLAAHQGGSQSFADSRQTAHAGFEALANTLELQLSELRLPPSEVSKPEAYLPTMTRSTRRRLTNSEPVPVYQPVA